jgi:hypothetical protein
MLLLTGILPARHLQLLALEARRGGWDGVEYQPGGMNLLPATELACHSAGPALGDMEVEAPERKRKVDKGNTEAADWRPDSAPANARL